MGKVFLIIESQSAHPWVFLQKHVHVPVLHGFLEACTNLEISNLQIAFGVYSSKEQHRRQRCWGHREEPGQEQVLDTPRCFIERLWRLWGYWHGQGHRLEFKPFVRRLEPKQVAFIHLKTYFTFVRGPFIILRICSPRQLERSAGWRVHGKYQFPSSEHPVFEGLSLRLLTFLSFPSLVDSDSQLRVLGICLSRARPDR